MSGRGRFFNRPYDSPSLAFLLVNVVRDTTRSIQDSESEITGCLTRGTTPCNLIRMSQLTELQAQQIVRRMHRLRDEVELFAGHARTLRLSSSSIDGRVLAQEADNLLRGLTASRIDFENASAQVGSLSRRLSPRASAAGGPPPVAKWGNEFRAGSKQFIAAVQNAEKQIGQLYGAASSLTA
jgi:hypothetical protein